MAVAPHKSRSAFGRVLREELGRQGLSVRKLARRLDPANPERARRNLTRWIGGGTMPTAASRALVAEALGCEASFFAAADDDEEDAEMADLVHALMRRIDQRVSEGISSALAKQEPAASPDLARDGLETTGV